MAESIVSGGGCLTAKVVGNARQSSPIARQVEGEDADGDVVGVVETVVMAAVGQRVWHVGQEGRCRPRDLQVRIRVQGQVLWSGSGLLGLGLVKVCFGRRARNTQQGTPWVAGQQHRCKSGDAVGTVSALMRMRETMTIMAGYRVSAKTRARARAKKLGARG